MKILFLGDSYSEAHNGWPSKVSESLNAESANFSRGASSLNYLFTKLDYELKNNFYDVVICTITSGDRLFHRDKLIHGGFPQYHDGTPLVDREKEAIKLFYTYLWDSQNGLINEQVFQLAMSAISLLHTDTKFIFLPAFGSWEHVPVGNYAYTNPRLAEFSELDTRSQQLEFNGKPSTRLNHLTLQQNNDLANCIVDMIKQYDFNTVSKYEINLSRL